MLSTINPIAFGVRYYVVPQYPGLSATDPSAEPIGSHKNYLRQPNPEMHGAAIAFMRLLRKKGINSELSSSNGPDVFVLTAHELSPEVRAQFKKRDELRQVKSRFMDRHRASKAAMKSVLNNPPPSAWADQIRIHHLEDGSFELPNYDPKKPKFQKPKYQEIIDVLDLPKVAEEEPVSV